MQAQLQADATAETNEAPPVPWLRAQQSHDDHKVGKRWRMGSRLMWDALDQEPLVPANTA